MKRFEQLQKTNIFRYPEVLTLLNAQTGTATKTRGWEGVGHLVHLLEDLTSPPHTNNDAHPHLSNIIANTLLGDPSQFELVNNNTDVLPEPPAGLLRSFDGLSESDIFKELQGFVAANFVSEKNVGRAEGVERGGYLVTIPEHCIVPDGPSCGRSVKIARISRKLLGIPVVLIDKTVAKEQFTRLAQTVVIYAASVLNFIHEKRAPVCEEQLAVSMSGAGAVSSVPAGLTCFVGACSHYFQAGGNVTLVATPAVGFRFVGWTDACSGSGTCTVRMDALAAKSVGVLFEPIPITSSPDITLISPSSVIGSNFDLTITGTGFDATGAVDQVYQPNGTFMGQGTIKSRSTTQIVVTELMAGAAPFTQPYIVKVKNPDGQLSNGISLTLSDEVSVSPGSGAAGTVFTYTGRGFTGNFGVTSHLKRPDGTEFSTLQIPTAAGGTFSTSINSAGFTTGTYEVWAVDNNAGKSSPHVTFAVGALPPPPAGPPEITSLGRPIAGEGDTVTISGRNFGALAGSNAVFFNGIRGEVTGASADRLVALVPRGATTGQVQVIVGGQQSNPGTLQVYPRRAQAITVSGPFDASPAPVGQTVNIGTFPLDFRDGDQVFLTGDPNTIIGPTFSGLPSPQFAGRLVMVVGGLEFVITPTSGPIDLRSFFGFTPGDYALGFRLEESGGQLSTKGLFLVNGPTSTGPFAGERFLTADTLDRRMTIRFRGLPVSEGSKVAVTSVNWYNLDGSCCNGSAGGTIVNGVVTPNDSRFRTLTVTNAEVAVTYSNVGLLANVDQTLTAMLSLVPADTSGNVTNTLPLAVASVLMGGLDSASTIPVQTSSVADGVDRPIPVTVNTLRDALGNRVPDGTKIALTAQNWFLRDGSCCNGSIGGTLTDGITAASDSRFKVYTVTNGRVDATFSAGGISLAAGQVQQAIISAVVADVSNNVRTTQPFAAGSLTLSSTINGRMMAAPMSLAATTMDNRSVVFAAELTDALGGPVPDGTNFAMTAANWFNLDGSCCNGSAGGALIGGVVASNDSRFRIFQVRDGQVLATYSDLGIVLNVGQTAAALVSLLPADGSNNIIGSAPIANVTITLAGIDAATVAPSQTSVLADGVDRPIPVVVSGIRDALGNRVPDGTKIALTAQNWFLRDGSCCNDSIGGTLTDGITAASDSRFKVYTVTNGRVDATFSAGGISLAAGQVQQAIISAVVADVSNNVQTARPFATGSLTLSSTISAQVTAQPASLLADAQQHLSVITASALTDSQGSPVPDGAKIGLTAVNWYNLDGSCCNGSAGGGFLGGAVASNDSRFRVFTVTSGQLAASYTDTGIVLDTNNTAPAVVSLLQADGNNNIIGNVPLANVVVTLAGMASGTFTTPATVAQSGTATVVLSDVRDAVGVRVPDGTKVALTAVNWYNLDGSCCNGSAGGGFTNGVTAENDSRFQVYTVTSGQIVANFLAPLVGNVTSVLSVVPADGSNNVRTIKPFAVASIRITPIP